jgi:hypothetical protein
MFLFSAVCRPTLWPIQSPIQWVMGALSLGVKWPGREADHFLLSSAEVKNGGAILLLPHTSSWGLIEILNTRIHLKCS